MCLEAHLHQVRDAAADTRIPTVILFSSFDVYGLQNRQTLLLPHRAGILAVPMAPAAQDEHLAAALWEACWERAGMS